MMLTIEQIRERQKFPIERVEIPEWGGCVFVRTLKAGEGDAYEESLRNSKGKSSLRGARAKLVVLCACDESGRRLFDDSHVEEISNWPKGPVDRIVEVAMRLNRMAREEVEDLVGNSPTTPSAASSTT